MAKKEKAAPKVVTVQDLATEFNMEPRKIRAIIRSLGHKAPEVDSPEGTFGPRAKYEWEEGSKDLAAIRKALETGEVPKKDKAEKEEKPAAKSKGKKAPKAEEPEDEDEESDEDEDEGDEE